MVPLYQYQQYNERIESSQKTQYPISGVDQVQKIDIRSKFHKTLEERIHEQYSAPEFNEKEKKHSIQKTDTHAYLMAKLTGKGREFSEYA